MPALITSVIPPQGFEQVRDAIGAILMLELANQKTLQGFDESPTVFIERIAPMQTDENLYFNVVVDKAMYNSFTARDTQGVTNYFIDVYATGKTTPATGDTPAIPGSYDASRRRDKFLGIARYIFASTFYNTLGFQPGFIGGVYVEGFAMAEPQTENSSYSAFGRIHLCVRILESEGLWTGRELLGMTTEIRLDETELGYQWINPQTT